MTPSPSTSPLPWHILALAAGSVDQLDQLTARLRGYLQHHPEHAVADVARALPGAWQRRAVGRFVICSDRADALEALASRGRMVTGDLRSGKPAIAFGFPGLGEQYVDMAAELYQTEAVFRECVDTCSQIVEPLLETDLREVLGWSAGGHRTAALATPHRIDLRALLRRGAAAPGEPHGLLPQTYVAQPATFIAEYALAQLWRSWGIHPDAMLGYSIGEYVAACLAGVMSLPDALRLVALRARLIQGLPEGGMIAVPRAEHEIQALLSEDLSLAAVNGEALCVLAGPPAAIDRALAQSLAGGEPAIRIPTTHAFHSSMMAPIAGAFRDIVDTCALQPPRLPYISNVTGTWITAAEATDPSYWTSHLCKPVRCLDGLRVLWRDPARVFLEVGPGRGLGSLALHNAPDDGRDHAALRSLRASYEVIPDRAVLLDTLGRLWLLGLPIEWRRILGDGHDARAHALHAHLSLSPAGPPAVELGIGASRSPDVAPEAAASAALEAAPVSHRGRPGLRPRPQLFTVFVAPDGDLELELATLWRDVLDLEAVGVDDNFFEVGGHSLLAMFILDHLERTTGVKLPLSVLFDHPTITQLAQALVTLQAPEGTRSQDMSAAAHHGARSGAAHHGRYRLPNGLEITHQNKAETDHFYADIFEHRTYLRQLGRLPEHACVFDVGANIGLFSLLVHTLDENAMIYAFEPSPPTFEILKHNLSNHRVRAKLFEIGLSDVEKTTDFTFYPFSSGMSSVYGDRAEERAVLQGIIQNQVHGDLSGALEQVAAYSEDLIEQRLKSQKLTCRLRTISSVIREEGIERIDLLKIDVQKSELDVLMGIEPRDWAKIHAIVIEVHDLDGRLHIVEQLLRKHAYEVEREQDDLYRGTAIYLVHAKRADGQLGGATKCARHS